MSNEIKFATHQKVRQELMKMQNCGGAMIKPFVLYQIVSMLLDEEEKTKLRVTQIRAIVETYCALCNEYFIIYHFEKNPKTEFFISEERWEKYFIELKTRHFAIDFLRTHGFIFCEEKANTDGVVVTTYKIDLEMLQNCTKIAEELYEQSKTKKRKFLD